MKLRVLLVALFLIISVTFTGAQQKDHFLNFVFCGCAK